MRVWVNGTFVDDKDAKISVFDAGFQHGVGLFETMIARNGSVFHARAHMERIAESASLLRLTDKLQTEPLVEALHLSLRENDQQEARVRLTVSGGDLNLLQQTGSGGGGDSTIVIQTQPPTKYPPTFYENGVMVSLASGRVNPYEFGAGHKTLNYWPKLLNLQLAAMQQCGEALWLTPSAHVAGGCVSNIFVVRDGVLVTPVARGEEGIDDDPSATLPGVTRSLIMRLADAVGVGTCCKRMTLDEVFSGDEVFLTNSSWGVLPVVGFRTSVKEDGENSSQDQMVGEGTVGKLASQLLESYRAALETETKGG